MKDQDKFVLVFMPLGQGITGSFVRHESFFRKRSGGRYEKKETDRQTEIERRPLLRSTGSRILIKMKPRDGKSYYSRYRIDIGGTIVSGPDGNLTWEVESILELKKENPDYQEGVSIYQYTLDEKGELLKQKEMGIYKGVYE